MAKAPKKPQRARDRGEVRLLTVELPIALDDALEAFRQKQMRTKKSVLIFALQEYLARHGAWEASEEP